MNLLCFSQKDFDVKRDMELIREILFKIEDKNDLVLRVIELPERDYETVSRYIEMLYDNGFIDGDKRRDYSQSFSEILVKDLSWDGHDLLDLIRSQDVWDKTKQGVIDAKSFSLDLLKSLAKGYAKTKIEEVTGLKLGDCVFYKPRESG